MRAVIFANGALSAPNTVHAWLRPDDWLLAADGGTRHCLALGLTPAAVIGDLDSLDPADAERLERAGVKLVRHPARKDFTDLELAVRFALALSVEEILVFGALGDRWDQTLANLLLPAAAGLEAARLRLVDGRQEVSLLRAGSELEITGSPGDTVSLIPIGGDAGGVTTHGLEYALEEGRLPFGATLGVSNVLTSQAARVSLRQGMLLCVVIHLG